MGFKHILEKINEDARKEADDILAETRRKADTILADAEAEAARLEATIRKQADIDSRQEAGRLVTQARLERNLNLLKSKKDLIDEILDEAFRSAFAGRDDLKKTLILKTGEKLETLDPKKLKEDLRSELEPLAAKILEI